MRCVGEIKSRNLFEKLLCDVLTKSSQGIYFRNSLAMCWRSGGSKERASAVQSAVEATSLTHSAVY